MSRRPSATTAIVGRSALSLRANFSWTLLGNIVYALSQWGMLSLLTKSSSSETVGQFAFAIAITTPIMAFSNLQLRSILATDATDQFPFTTYLRVRTFTALLGIVGVLCVTEYLGRSDEMRWVISIVGLGKAADSLSDVAYGLFQKRHRMDILASGMILNGAVSFLLFGMAVVFLDSLLAAVIGSSLASFIALVAINLRSARRFTDGGALWNSSDMKSVALWIRDAQRLVRLAFPLGMVTALGSLTAQVPLFFVEGFQGSGALGVYSALAYLTVAGTTIITALAQSASPRLASAFAQHDLEGFRRLLKRLVAFGLGLGVAGATLSTLAGSMILSVFYTEEYASYRDLLSIISLSAGVMFAATFMGYAMTATRRFTVQVPLLVVVGLTSLLANFLLVPRYGLNGAAIATSISGSVQFLGSAFIVNSAVAKVQQEPR